jgi:hypothetical protein
MICYDIRATMARILDYAIEDVYEEVTVSINITSLTQIYHGASFRNWNLLWSMEIGQAETVYEAAEWFWKYGVSRISATSPTMSQRRELESRLYRH